MLTAQLRELAIGQALRQPGIEISNAGGCWHSGRDLFRGDLKSELGDLCKLAVIALNAVMAAEEAAGAPALSRLADDTVVSALDTLSECDAWLNVSRARGWCEL